MMSRPLFALAGLLLTFFAAEALAQGPPPGWIRTPDERFDAVPGFPDEPRYVTFADGVRMHYVERGGGDVLLVLHGEPTWGFLSRDLIEGLSRHGRVIVPDLMGFGRSDKPIARSQCTVAMHFERLTAFVEALDLINVTLVGHDWGGLLGLALVAHQPERFARLVVLNTPAWPLWGHYGPESQGGPTQAFLQFRRSAETWTDVSASGLVDAASVSPLTPAERAAYDAPFPDVSYKAGPLTFPLLMPITTLDPSAIFFYQAGRALQGWSRPAFVLFSDRDPILRNHDGWFRQLLPTSRNEPVITIQNAGHFLQEDAGAAVAQHIADFLERRPINPKRLR